MNPPDTYPYVVAWGQLMGSYEGYINDQVHRARLDQAPPDAIYRRDDGTWVTTADIVSARTRLELGLQPLPVREPDLAVIASELRKALLLAEIFHDLFGLVEVEILSPDRLVIWFSTDWSITLKLQPHPPEVLL